MKNKLIIDKTLIFMSTNNIWGMKQKKIYISEFYKGFNIFSTLANSLYGQIKNTFSELFSEEDVKEYVLPTVIVIGNESTGKSSLLENITKCQLFPRDSKLCTKCPIRVRLNNGPSNYKVSYPNINKIIELNNKNEIFGIIQKYMSDLPIDYISEDEIIIDITDTDMPNFEFYDLPGIRTYPFETATKTINLCKKYLINKNSIILCVVPATTTRLTSCQSIALITEMKMENNCILALTMADRLQPENIEELLIKRIIQTSDEINGLYFAGYVSVVNRVHLDNFSLEENDNNEYKWFYDNIIGGIPDEYKEYENIIKENITIGNLIFKMDKLYNNFIHNNWKPRILDSIKEKIQFLKNKRLELGDELTDQSLINDSLYNLLNYNLLNSDYKELILDEKIINDISDTDNNEINDNDESIELKNEINNNEINDNEINDNEINDSNEIELSLIFEMTSIQLQFFKKNFKNLLLIKDFEFQLYYKTELLIKTYLIIMSNNFIENLIKLYFDYCNIHIKDIYRFSYAKNKFIELYNIYYKNLIINNYNNIISDFKILIINNNIKPIICKLFRLYKLHILYPLSQYKINLDLKDYIEDELYIQKRETLNNLIIKAEIHYKKINTI